MNYTKRKISEARDRAAMAAMVDIDSFLSALDDIEYLSALTTRLTDLIIVTDTNGQYCRLCNDQDQDGEVIHRKGCEYLDAIRFAAHDAGKEQPE